MRQTMALSSKNKQLVSALSQNKQLNSELEFNYRMLQVGYQFDCVFLQCSLFFTTGHASMAVPTFYIQQAIFCQKVNFSVLVHFKTTK